MRFRRLKLAGFKSFVEPAELHIERGLTGVVGPNGCGKSNLLEAIRWVMGESSPKSLRGGGMDDVIFAGTAQRPPRDFAEVVLTAEGSLDGADNDGELEIVRRIERGSGSAYRINGRDVRQKDVSLLFADAATGAHSPALVSQGRIAAVIAAKPAQRREMLEEAAGISGLHVRRKDAEQKLRATESNLARLDDMLAGLDGQIAALRRQARAAERYKAISEQLRLAEARLVFARWRDAAADADAARGEADVAERAVAEAQAATREVQDRQAAAALALNQAREELSDRRQDSAAHGHRLAALTGQLEAVEERLADVDRQLRRLEEDQGHADRMTEDAAAALARLEREGAAAVQSLADEEKRRPQAIAAQEDAERASRAAELALANALAEQAGLDAEWRVAEAAVSAAQARLTRIAAEEDRRKSQEAALMAEGDPALAVSEARAAFEQCERASDLARAAREEVAEGRDALVAARDAAAEALAEAKAERATVENEHRALARDKAAREARVGRAGGASAISGVKVAPGYERALAAVLGRDAQAPTGPQRAGQDGRFWTGAAAPTAVPDALARHVTASPPELAARLALVHVTQEDDGRALKPGEWLVTLDGALRRWDGFVARGEGAAEAAVLEADNRLAELEDRLPALIAAQEKAEASASRATSDLARHGEQVREADSNLVRAIEAERAAQRALDQTEAAATRAANRREEIALALAEIASQREAAVAELQAAEDKRATLPDPAVGRAALDAARSRNDAARQALQIAMATLSSLEQGLAVARERSTAIGAEIAGWQERASDAARRLADMARRREELAEERAVVAAKPEALLREIEQADAIRDRLAAELGKAEAALQAAEEVARAADGDLARRSDLLGDLREARAGAIARAENQAQRRDEMSRLSGERFQCPPPLLPERFAFTADSVARGEAEQATMDKLTADRERLGPVNLVAADELVTVEAQHGSALAEKEELAEAVSRLRGSIGALNREGRERLRAAFDAVDTHFRRLFTRLFNGGQAHLAMIDSDDPLEAGLEIFAQPPGKKLQSLTLLSGGEQALTAVALIFALFLTNPAPICVLDEVDAPLDDANIERFCDLLDAMTDETDTRFLIVTHNAVTMSRMHRLFGVTMVEQGVSRLVSVDLGTAEKLVA